MEFKWEEIHEIKDEVRNDMPWQFDTARAKVKGGWIVSSSLIVDYIPSLSICFVPDENHEWEVKNNNPLCGEDKADVSKL